MQPNHLLESVHLYSTTTLKVPSAPRFFARNTSAMPPAPSRPTISNYAIWLGMRAGVATLDIRLSES